MRKVIRMRGRLSSAAQAAAWLLDSSPHAHASANHSWRGLMDEHYELFAEAMRRKITPATMAPAGQITVAKAALGNDAGLVGAASLVFAARGE